MTKKKSLNNNLQKIVVNLTQRLEEAMKSFSVSNAHDSTEFMDIASDNEADEMQARIAEAASHQIDQINCVLEKLKGGTYGICEECGEKIAVARLKAIPFATLCISCKEIEEQGIGLSVPSRRPSTFQSFEITDDDKDDVVIDEHPETGEDFS